MNSKALRPDDDEQDPAATILAKDSDADVSETADDETEEVAPVARQRGPRPRRRGQGDRDSIQAYFRDIKEVPLLKAEDEVALAKRIAQGDTSAFEIGRAHV